MVKALMRHAICLSGSLGIHLNSRREVVSPGVDSLILVHSMSDLIMPMFGVTCVILLIMILIRAIIMHAMLNLTLHRPGAILILS